MSDGKSQLNLIESDPQGVVNTACHCLFFFFLPFAFSLIVMIISDPAPTVFLETALRSAADRLFHYGDTDSAQLYNPPL